jgi:hypothetical protein
MHPTIGAHAAAADAVTITVDMQLDVSQEPIVDASWLKSFLSSTLKLTVAGLSFNLKNRRSLLLKHMSITFTVQTSLAATRFASASALANSIRATLGDQSSVGSQLSAKWGIEVLIVGVTAYAVQAAVVPSPEASASLNVYIIAGGAAGGLILLCMGFLFYRFRVKHGNTNGRSGPEFTNLPNIRLKREPHQEPLNEYDLGGMLDGETSSGPARNKLKSGAEEVTLDELASRAQLAKPVAVDSIPFGELRLEARSFAQGGAGQVFRGASNKITLLSSRLRIPRNRVQGFTWARPSRRSRCCDAMTWRSCRRKYRR